jgi:hypothetical protein
MTLISSGIEKVRAYELPSGVWSDGKHVGLPRIVLVKWRSCWNDKFYQIYANGRYAGVTIDSQQRQMIVQIPTSFETPVRIEVFAVEAEQVDSDFSDEIDASSYHSGRVRITFLRGQNLPIGSVGQVYFDNGTGEIDYDNPVNDYPIKIWSAWQDKAGFGMSKFGVTDFGYDSAAAVGFGKGCFGWSQFGVDADVLEWLSRPMETGIYKFAIVLIDNAGNRSNSSETTEVTVTPAARPAEQLSISSFDKETNKLVLNIS